ncbi:MAG: outer membrane beta-barrel protein [Bacteroidetes bacterium]|nr:outer membrane beta-barrel protein [Bacteroidota bacterium]MCB9225686.1 outer membrane beta-barrel protein [Chitinophagales bacterium]
MRNLLLLLCVFSFAFLSAQSETKTKEKKGRAYFTFKTGYTFPVAKTTVGSPKPELGKLLIRSNDDPNNYQYSEKQPFGTRGAGFQVAGSVGYMFIDNFGLEMEFSFLRSSKILDARRDETNAAGLNYFAEQYSYTNMVRMAPMVVVSGNPNKKFTPYGKFGILLPFAGKTIVEATINDKTGVMADNTLPLLNKELADSIASHGLNIPIPTETYIKAKTAGQFSIGFAARVGCTYNITPKWSVFAEAEMNMLTIKAKDTKFVDFSTETPEDLIAAAEIILGMENIQSKYGMEDLPEILRVTEYKNEITETSNSSYNYARKDEPLEQVTFRDSYNSFGFMLGFKYNFGK